MNDESSRSGLRAAGSGLAMSQQVDVVCARLGRAACQAVYLTDWTNRLPACRLPGWLDDWLTEWLTDWQCRPKSNHSNWLHHTGRPQSTPQRHQRRRRQRHQNCRTHYTNSEHDTRRDAHKRHLSTSLYHTLFILPSLSLYRPLLLHCGCSQGLIL